MHGLLWLKQALNACNRGKNGTQACRDDAEHHDERSAATTLTTSNDAVFFPKIIIDIHVWLCLWKERI